ncbi:MAG: fatty acid desaturase [Pseudomonadota bacterium]
MTTHSELLASLSDDEKAYLTQRSNQAGGRQLLWHGSVIVFLAIGVVKLPAGWILQVPLGIALVFLFTALHECMHRTPFATDRYSDWLANFISLVLFLPSEWFRFFHFAHHRYTHQPDKDPELETPLPDSLTSYLWYLTGLSVWWSQLSTLVRNASGKAEYTFVPKGGRPKVVREARVMLLIYLTLFAITIGTGSTVLIEIWLLPILLGQPFLRVYLLAEHRRCPHTRNMFENTRTTYTHGLIRKLAWNMPYHVEHHAWPSVPFHRLPNLHKHTRIHLKETSNGYLDFHRSLVADLNQI